jgi:hypothetical protein
MGYRRRELESMVVRGWARTCFRLRLWMVIRRRLRTFVFQVDPGPDLVEIDLDRLPKAVRVACWLLEQANWALVFVLILVGVKKMRHRSLGFGWWTAIGM